MVWILSNEFNLGLEFSYATYNVHVYMHIHVYHACTLILWTSTLALSIHTHPGVVCPILSVAHRANYWLSCLGAIRWLCHSAFVSHRHSCLDDNPTHPLQVCSGGSNGLPSLLCSRHQDKMDVDRSVLSLSSAAEEVMGPPGGRWIRQYPLH